MIYAKMIRFTIAMILMLIMYSNGEVQNATTYKLQTAILHGDTLNLDQKKDDLDLVKSMYYYIDVEVGTFDSKKSSKMSLMVDTGSTLTGFPCKNYCENCGTHLNEYFALDDSKTKEFISKTSFSRCDEKDKEDDKCYFEHHLKEKSSYKGFYVKDVMTLTENTNKNSNSNKVIFG